MHIYYYDDYLEEKTQRILKSQTFQRSFLSFFQSALNIDTKLLFHDTYNFAILNVANR
jgi:hypothetical protein